MIIVDKLYKGFEGTQVLKGISTTFEPGKTSLIIGQSGSGKTVLLKCLLGLFDYEEGSIAYDEKIFLSLSDNEKRTLRSQIGMVFQGGALFDSLSIAENVMFPLRMFTKQSRSEMEDRVNLALKRVNLENSNSKFPAEISLIIAAPLLIACLATLLLKVSMDSKTLGKLLKIKSITGKTLFNSSSSETNSAPGLLE